VHPQECGNLPVTLPKVTDVAVFGVPNEDLGEEVKAVVQAAPGVLADAELAAELIAFCREHLAHIKCPRSIDWQALQAPAARPLLGGSLEQDCLKMQRHMGDRSAHPVDSAQSHRSISMSGACLGRPPAGPARGRVRDQHSRSDLTKVQI